MMHKIGISLLLVLLMFGGCAGKITICPKYPKTKQSVLNKIKSLNDKDVDAWIIEQYKLNKQLKVCNE